MQRFPVSSTPTKRKPSAIFTQQQLDNTRPHFERAVALLMLMFSIAGSIITFCGGWENLSTGNWLWPSFVIGACVQILCIVLEWWWRRNRWSIPYMVALAVDTGTTIVGFGPIFHDNIAARIPVAQDLASWLAWCIIGAIALLLAWVPEGRLID